MKVSKIWLVATLLLTCASTLSAEWIAPDISNAEVEVEVGFDPATGIYRYDYKLINPSSNFAPIRAFWVTAGPEKNTSSIEDRPYMDKSNLPSDGSLNKDRSFHSGRSIPLGIESPTGFEATIGRDGDVVWLPDTPWGQPLDFIDPGEVVSGFRLHSRVPPGVVTALLKPKIDMGPGSPYEEYGELCGEDNSPCPDPNTFWEERQVVGPQLPEERELIDGKGQRSRDVNRFLRFANPLETSVNLSPDIEHYDLVVVFGETIVPASFEVSLNRSDITDRFTVAPGGTAVVKLPLEPGRNKVVLSIDGERDDGRIATDTDQITFVVK
ncbi:hypothetical protein [Thiohalomonas denitrificans]|uniref:hypothetical protein n=1 Tax=Thiohalomonas denitrificans TaxID=415747 RepID=UPI0026F2378C|nr:hypothetical protein [Thiohalomonas denitrificans]